MAIYGYARVSTKEQNTNRQIIALKEHGINEGNIIVDKESGKDFNREGYIKLKNDMLRSGDTLMIKSLDRLSRNKSDIKQELEYFKVNNIRLKVLDLPTTMIEMPSGQDWVMEMVNNILIEVLGTIAEQERETMRQRQAEGIAAARLRGVKFGRPPKNAPENFGELVRKWERKQIPFDEVLKLCDMKATTFYKKLAEHRIITGKAKKSTP